MTKEELIRLAHEKALLEMENEFTTMTSGDSWDDSTITIEKLREMIKELEPLLKKRKEFESKVLEYVKYLPLCPLIKKMYGSREGAFGVTAPPIKFEPIEIKRSTQIEWILSSCPLFVSANPWGNIV